MSDIRDKICFITGASSGIGRAATLKFLKADDVADVTLFVLAQPAHVLIREINFDNIAFFKK